MFYFMGNSHFWERKIFPVLDKRVKNHIFFSKSGFLMSYVPSGSFASFSKPWHHDILASRFKVQGDQLF